VLHISLARWSALALLVAQVSPATPGFGGTAWRLTHLGDKPVTSVNAKAAPTLLFDVKTSRFSGSGGCNRISGAYKHQGKALTFGAVVATKMACPGGIMNVEAEFTKALEQVRTWRLAGRTLQLLDAHTRVLARFESSAGTSDASEPPPFANKVWKVEKSTGVQPGQVYVFLSDGTLLITSGNSIPTLGKWTFDGTALTMIEEGSAHKVDILSQREDRLSIRIHSPGPPLDISLVRVTTPGPVK
jgi:heat shock protein HslJ